ncbi:MAG: hypothetical protein GX878_00495 [Firmicutes bacterium]|nr:hypothetical protein [Bacillota bacterium]
MDQVSLPGLLIHLTGKPCQLLPFATIISSGELPVKPKMSHNNSLVPGAWWPGDPASLCQLVRCQSLIAKNRERWQS